MKRSSKLITESALIVFSVLFALLLNECRNAISDKRETRVVLNNILDEVRNNETYVKELSQYHFRVRDNIARILQQDTIEVDSFFGDLGFWMGDVAPNGVIQGEIHNISWDAARMSGITKRLAFDDYTLLSRTYTQQATINETIQRILEIYAQRETYDPAQLRISLQLLYDQFNEVATQEQVQLRLYELVLEQLE